VIWLLTQCFKLISFFTYIVIKDYSDLLNLRNCKLRINDAISTFLMTLCFSRRRTELYEIFTHRRSTAEQGACFQRRLFICLSVCLFVNTITSERLNVGRWNLAVRALYKNLAWVRMSTSKVKVTGTKNEKLLSHLPLKRRAPYSAYSSRRYHCVAAGGDRVTAVHADGGLRERSSGSGPRGPCVRQFYAGGKISACCLVKER